MCPLYLRESVNSICFTRSRRRSHRRWQTRSLVHLPFHPLPPPRPISLLRVTTIIKLNTSKGYTSYICAIQLSPPLHFQGFSPFIFKRFQIPFSFSFPVAIYLPLISPNPSLQ